MSDKVADLPAHMSGFVLRKIEYERTQLVLARLNAKHLEERLEALVSFKDPFRAEEIEETREQLMNWKTRVKVMEDVVKRMEAEIPGDYRGW